MRLWKSAQNVSIHDSQEYLSSSDFIYCSLEQCSFVMAAVTEIVTGGRA